MIALVRSIFGPGPSETELYSLDPPNYRLFHVNAG
jgi:hypothetical protein